MALEPATTSTPRAMSTTMTMHLGTASQALLFDILLGGGLEAAPEGRSRERRGRKGGGVRDWKDGVFLPVGDVPPAEPFLVSVFVDLGWDTEAG